LLPVTQQMGPMGLRIRPGGPATSPHTWFVGPTPAVSCRPRTGELAEYRNRGRRQSRLPIHGRRADWSIHGRRAHWSIRARGALGALARYARGALGALAGARATSDGSAAWRPRRGDRGGGEDPPDGPGREVERRLRIRCQALGEVDRVEAGIGGPGKLHHPLGDPDRHPVRRPPAAVAVDEPRGTLRAQLLDEPAHPGGSTGAATRTPRRASARPQGHGSGRRGAAADGRRM
jgi:hypothetical protein